MKKVKILLRATTWIIVGIWSGCQLTVAQQGGHEAMLSGIELGFDKSAVEYVTCTLNEAFAPDCFDYTATVDKLHTSGMYITPFLEGLPEEHRISINNMFARSGERFYLEIKEGDNPVAISVTSRSGKSNTYHLVITQKDLSPQYKVEVIGDGIWRICDFNGFPGNQSMYLVEGKDKALFFDTGMGTGSLPELIKELTVKPVELVITHGHGDHTYNLNQFEGYVVYMPEKDKDMLSDKINTSKFNWINEGDILDLGNGRTFEVLELPSHSPGSAVFLDVADQIAITGDAIGSGDVVWVFWIPFEELQLYADGLKKIERRIRDLDGLTLLGGHSWQERTPLTGIQGKQLFTDMRVLTEKVLRGELIGEMVFMDWGGKKTPLRRAYYGLAGLLYNPN